MKKRDAQNYDDFDNFSNKLYVLNDKKIPAPQMRLFCFQKAFSESFQREFFDTDQELIEYARSNDKTFGDVCIIEYLGDFAGRSDVIKKIDKDYRIRFYTAIDEDGYGIYNPKRNSSAGEPIWEYNYGDLREMYSAFRDRGITFTNDIYAKIDKENQQTLEREKIMMRELMQNKNGRNLKK